jgi:hypothetical protein
VPQHRARGMADLEHSGAQVDGHEPRQHIARSAPETLTAAQASLWSVSAAPGIVTGSGPMTNHWSSPLQTTRVAPLSVNAPTAGNGAADSLFQRLRHAIRLAREGARRR